MSGLNAPPVPVRPADAPAAPPRAAAPGIVGHPGLVVCDSCDAVHQRVRLGRGIVARCTRCGALLGRGHVVTPSGQLAFALAALLFLVIGNVAPLVTLDLQGNHAVVTLPHALRLTWQEGEALTAVLAAVTALVLPAVLLVLRVYVLLFLVNGRVPPGFRQAMHVLRFATHWSMVEVFLLSALVSIVRSAGIATLHTDIGLFAYAALTLLLTSIAASGLHAMWKLGSRLGAG